MKAANAALYFQKFYEKMRKERGWWLDRGSRAEGKMWFLQDKR